ncbi:hypothetical protein HYZ97_02710 [Candidatus Pacearchaeota archaeon]|nr:hypothetical protein [Candidatus Pacearchaeota archaeon]
MAEEVSTGGLVKFKYSGEKTPSLSDERRREIRNAYLRAEERKIREKRNKALWWILIALVIIGVVIIFFNV